MMLFIAPSTVDMKKAVKAYHPGKGGGLSRDPNGTGDYSASGVFGDATLATRKKGEIMVHAIVEGILKEIDDLRGARCGRASSHDLKSDCLSAPHLEQPRHCSLPWHSRLHRSSHPDRGYSGESLPDPY